MSRRQRRPGNEKKSDKLRTIQNCLIVCVGTNMCAMLSVVFNCRFLATHEKVSRLNLCRMHASIALA